MYSKTLEVLTTYVKQNSSLVLTPKVIFLLLKHAGRVSSLFQ